MRDLWKAFVARIVYWLTPKPPLTSEICQCEHWRCAHVRGEGHCVFEYPQEKEEFFASTDAITGLPNGSLAGAIHPGWTNKVRMPNFVEAVEKFIKDLPPQPPIEWSTGAWNGPLIELDPNDPFGHMESLFSSGIHVTSIVPPEQGWPVAMHCPLCKETVFMLSLWAIKPKDGDFFKINKMCVNEELGFKHNMKMSMK